MSIQNYLNQIKNAVFGKDVRQSIYDAIKQCYDDASINHDNANMEVKLARGSHDTLNERFTSVEENIKTTNEQLDKNMNYISKKEKLNMYRYLITTFTANSLDDDNSHLHVYLSNDGINWNKFSEYDKKLRDPFVFRYNNSYYITATNLINRTSICYLKTDDFINFEEIEHPYTGVSQYSYIWAPSVFEYKNELYMTLSLSASGTIETLSCYISKLDSNLMPTAFEKITGDLPTSFYDAHFIPTNDKIYVYYKNSTSGQTGMQIAQSDNLLSGYEIIGYNNLDNQQEAPFYIKMDDNTIRMYMDTHQGQGGITFIDYKDNERTWTNPESVTFDDNIIGKHCHIIDLSGYKWEPTYKINPSCYTLTDCNDLKFNKYNTRLTTNTTLNLPNINDGDKWGKVELIDMGNNKIQLFTSLSLRYFIRNYVNNIWSDWKEFSNTNINTWKNITLINGITSYDSYTTPVYKLDGDTVWIKGVIKGVTQNNMVIGNIPDGFRPKLTWSFVQRGIGDGVACFTIESNGDIKFIKNTNNVFDTTGWQPINCCYRID